LFNNWSQSTVSHNPDLGCSI